MLVASHAAAIQNGQDHSCTSICTRGIADWDFTIPAGSVGGSCSGVAMDDITLSDSDAMMSGPPGVETRRLRAGDAMNETVTSAETTNTAHHTL